MDLRRPEADLADIHLPRNRLQFQPADGQCAPGGQIAAGRVAHVQAAQPQVADDADLGRRVLGLFEDDLQIRVEQRALDLEGKRHGPDVGPLLELQAVEGHAQRGRGDHIERPRHAGQVEGAAVDAQVQARLHVDVGGVAEGRDERHPDGELVHDLLAAGDLVVQRDGAVLDHHVVERKARQSFVRLGRLLGLGGGQFGHALFYVREIEAQDVFADDGDVRLPKRQTVDHRREPEQRCPRRAGIQFSQGQQRRLRARLRHGQVLCADGQRERIEGDLADRNVAPDHLCDVIGQHAVQHFRHLPRCHAKQNQHERHNTQENLAGASGEP